MIPTSIAEYILKAFIGCILLDPSADSELQCASLESLKSLRDASGTTSLTIVGNQIDRDVLEKEHVEKVPNVTSFSCHQTLSDISGNAFAGLKHLETFDCVACHLPVIRATYFENPSVRYISIAKSGVTDIEPGAFSKLPSCEELDLRENEIRVIKRNVFRNAKFRIVYLCTNNIESIEDEAFFSMDRLIYLNLEDNYLKTFNSEKLIGKSLSLVSLVLRVNDLTELSEETTKSVPNLRYLSVASNAIGKIDGSPLKDLKHLYKLDLSDNKNQELKPTLVGENNITYLILHRNKFADISMEFLTKLPRLEHITIAENPLQCRCRDNLTQYFIDRNIKDGCFEETEHECVEDIAKSGQFVPDSQYLKSPSDPRCYPILFVCFEYMSRRDSGCY